MSIQESYREEAVLFACAGETLVGVLARPEAPSGLGIVIVVGGPQYRAGSHRQFVRLARALADAGHAVLRFDCRGMGDSSGTQRDFLAIDEDIGAAIDAVQKAVPTVQGIALFGLCDAASASLLYWHQTRDARVERLILLNPWVRSPQGLARTQVKHYYRRRLLEPEFWAKLATGKIARDAFSGLLRSLKTAFASVEKSASAGPSFTARMASAWDEFGGSILLLLSGNDYTSKEFVELTRSDAAWQKALQHPRLSQRALKTADHTFSDPADARLMEQYTFEWLTSGGSGVDATSRQPLAVPRICQRLLED